MSKNVEELIELAYDQIGSPYVFGTWGQLCSVDLRERYASYNPSHKNDIYKACQRLSNKAKTCEGCKYKDKLAFDCRGFTDWCLKNAGIIDLAGSGATEQYETAKNWTKKGAISKMPDLPCILFQYRNGRMQHTGVYVGGGKIIHASTGVIESKITTAWTHYALPKGMYTSKEIKAAPLMIWLITLRRNSKGDAVKELQTLLKNKGYYNGEINGEFDAATLEAVKTFQRDAGLTVDGVVATQTWEALKAEEYKTVVIITASKGAKTYCGDTSKSDRVGTAAKGAQYDWVATSAITGFYGFRIDTKQVVWVASKYAKLGTVKK